MYTYAYGMYVFSLFKDIFTYGNTILITSESEHFCYVLPYTTFDLSCCCHIVNCRTKLYCTVQSLIHSYREYLGSYISFRDLINHNILKTHYIYCIESTLVEVSESLCTTLDENCVNPDIEFTSRWPISINTTVKLFWMINQFPTDNTK